MNPLIGVTGNESNAREYVEALVEAGCRTTLLAPDVNVVDAQLERIDGVVVTGGYDVDPAHYGAAPHAHTEIADAALDAHELALVRRARERDVPLFAICRGIQTVNVAFGGTLVQHLPEQVGELIRHRWEINGRSYRGLIAEHVVDIEPDSRLAAMAGTTSLVTGARHHQAVDRVADDLRVVGRTPDGVIEAVEPRWNARFFLAVQWHPESTRDDDHGASRALFAAFAAACGATAPA